MKTIGIITMYTNSCNYGGLLQASALTNKIKQMGYCSKQISLLTKKNKKNNIINIIKLHGFKYFLTICKKHIEYRCKSSIEEKDLVNTKKLCRDFREGIPHIEFNEIDKLNNEFDLFITGSDQVWNPKYNNEAYYLSFATKKKISYASSIARYDFTRYEKGRLELNLKSFNWISVREEQAVSFLKSEFGIKSDLVLDPTMLLTKEQWEQEEEKVDVEGKYVFCYFLSGNKKKRLFAQRFAQEKGLKLIYPIYVGETIRYDDESHNEQMLYDVGPRQWVYLIHHAEYILTDSFHGTVFSIIFNKQFYHLMRETKKGKQTMGSRIDSLLKMFGLEKQLCKCNDKNVDSEIDYSQVNLKLEKEKSKSIDLLLKALEN